MAIVRNTSDGPLIIGGTRPIHLLPGRAITIADNLLKLPQINNLMKKKLLKTVKIEKPQKPAAKAAEKAPKKAPTELKK